MTSTLLTHCWPSSTDDALTPHVLSLMERQCLYALSCTAMISVMAWRWVPFCQALARFPADGRRLTPLYGPLSW